MASIFQVPGEKREPCPFKVGDRVTMRDGLYMPTVDIKHRTGTVSMVPGEDVLVVVLGGFRLGEEIAVEMDGGGRGVGHWSDWVPA